MDMDLRTEENLSENNKQIIDIINTIWKGKITLFICTGIGLLLGIFVAISTPNEYTVTTVMVPQMGKNPSTSSSLSSLAAMAGISMDMAQSSELSPLVYPRIINSVPFKLELMNAPLNFSDVDKPVSIFDYYTKYKKPNLLGKIKMYTIGLPALILSSIKKKDSEAGVKMNSGKQPIGLTRKQNQIKKLLDNLVVLTVEKKEGYLILTVRMSQALAAAQLAQKTQDLLQSEITKLKISKTQADLDFIQGRYNDAKKEFEKVQVELAMTTDRNRDLVSGVSTVNRDRIQTKYTVAYSVFQELSKQLEQTKIQVKKETPVFAIVEPVAIPAERSRPNRVMLMFIWIIMGGLTGVGIVYGKTSLKNFLVEFKEVKE